MWSVRIVVLELATGGMIDVSAGHFDSTPVWSPDSTTLLYRKLSASRQDYEVWRVSRQGTDSRPVISAPADDGLGQDYWPTGWSADGKRILAYVQNLDDTGGWIVTFRPDGTGLQKIMSERQPFPGETGSGSLQFLTWSPDERSIVFRTAQGLRFVNMDNTGHRMLDPTGEYQQRWQADWAPF
jgi:Tol biopolymer transport system component